MAGSWSASSSSNYGGGGSSTTSSGVSSSEWSMEDSLKAYENSLKFEAEKKKLDQQYGIGGNSASTSNKTTGDWNSSNPSYSTGLAGLSSTDYMQMAKDMSNSYLQNSLTLMDASSGYRQIEADQNTRNTDKLSRRQSYYDTKQYTNKTTDDMRRDEQAANYEMRNYSAKTTDDMRRDGQQQDFQKMLDKLKYEQESKMQGAQFQQDEEMFNLADQAKMREKQMNRQAASNLYNTSGMSPFYGGY